jgi:hypothetical protein
LFFLLVILLEVDIVGMTFSKLECDAPRSVHVHGVTRGLETMQGMKLSPSKGKSRA